MKGKKGQPRDTQLAAKYQDVEHFTTVMIRNIPSAYTQDEFLCEVAEVLGSTDVFDFFYLPWDLQSNCNMTYAFINFLDDSIAQQAVTVFSNYRFRTHESRKAGQVLPAHVQGLQNNLRHLQDRAVTHGNRPCSPLVMWKGRKIELSRVSQGVMQKLREACNVRGLRSLDDSALPNQMGGSYGGYFVGQGFGEHGYGKGSMQSPMSTPGGQREPWHQHSDNSIDSNFAMLLDRAADMCAVKTGQELVGISAHVMSSQTGHPRSSGQKESLLAEKYQAVDEYTTIMIRNIPGGYTQSELLTEVGNVMGSFVDVFDFFYLPWDLQNNANVGYAFVNFLDSARAQRAVELFSNYRFKLHEMQRGAQVLPAHIQGLRNNLMHLQDRAVANGNHPCSPVVMWKGMKIELSRISQELKIREALRKFRAPANHGRRGSESVDDSVIPSMYRGDVVGGTMPRAPPASQPSSSSVTDGASAEEFIQVLDKVAGMEAGEHADPCHMLTYPGNGGMVGAAGMMATAGMANSAAMAYPHGMMSTPGISNSPVMACPHVMIANPGMGNPGMGNAGMMGNMGVMSNSGAAGMMPYGGMVVASGMDHSMMCQAPDDARVASFFEDDEANPRLPSNYSDASTGSAPSFKMPKPRSTPGKLRCGSSTGVVQPPMSTPCQTYSRMRRGVADSNMSPSDASEGMALLISATTPPLSSTPQGSSTGRQQQPRHGPGRASLTPPGSRSGHQQLPCDSRGGTAAPGLSLPASEKQQSHIGAGSMPPKWPASGAAASDGPALTCAAHGADTPVSQPASLQHPTGTDGALEITVHSSQQDVLQKFLMKFGS